MTNQRRDATDSADAKFRRGIDWVQEQLNDRWPARGRANQVDRDWPPRDVVSRHGRLVKYEKWPNAPR